MSKSFTKAVVAGSVLASTIGNVGLVAAYSGETDYPENQTMGLVTTVIDVRHNEITAHLREVSSSSAILKGLMFFEGDVEDAELLTAYPGDEYEMTQYYRFDFESADWEDKATGEEMTVETVESLEENTSRKLGFTYYFWVNDIIQQMNIRWGRIDYERCANSAAFLENEEAICRAEIWDDGEIHYQPYVGWERLSLEDGSDEEAGTILVYKDNEWVTEGDENGEGNEDNGDNGDAEDGDNEASGESNEGGEVETGSGETGDSSSDEVSDSGADAGAEESGGEVEIRYVEKEVIKEVPVEKIKTVEVEKPVEVVKTVKVEVPVEKVKTVEVQVPVEKTIVETKEIVKEVPATGTMLLTGATNLGELALSGEIDETADETSDGPKDEEPGDDEEFESFEEEQEDEAVSEVVEIPELGKETSTDASMAGKIATFVAGIVSVIALLVLGIALKRRKADN